MELIIVAAFLLLGWGWRVDPIIVVSLFILVAPFWSLYLLDPATRLETRKTWRIDRHD